MVDALHELFPDAPVFTLVFDPKFREKYKNWDIRTSSLQTLYLALGRLQYLLPLIPWGVDNLDFTGFDLVISSSSGFVKNIRLPKNCTHINYCHTPTRFLWSEPNYVKQEVPWLIRPLVKLLLHSMRKWDKSGAQRVTKFIANSKEVQSRIKKYYGRDSDIVYPFIDTSFWHPVEVSFPNSWGGIKGEVKKGDYFLLAGRLQAHKQNELIVEIFNELGLPLHVVGTGRQENYLRSVAKPNIKFFGFLSNERLREEYSGAKALIYPQLEDFGLMPLEAAACGTATLALGKGGALETIIPGVTGDFFDSYDKEKIKQSIFSWNPQKYSVENLRRQAEKFGKEKFKDALARMINENVLKDQKGDVRSVSSYDRISPTAWTVAYRRTLTDIPYSREIFEEMENIRKSGSGFEITEELKFPVIAPLFEARYKLTNKLLRENNCKQILEIASGFVPRGLDLTKDESITYVELDLAAVMGQKKLIVNSIINKLNETPRKNLFLEPGNALNIGDLRLAANHFDKTQPIAIIHEGLLRYIGLEDKGILAKNFKVLLQEFGGVWITPDIYIKEREIMKEQNKRVEKLIGIKFDSNRFRNEDAAKSFFESFGFTIERREFMEIFNELVSPKLLKQTDKEARDLIFPSITYVMRLK